MAGELHSGEVKHSGIAVVPAAGHGFVTPTAADTTTTSSIQRDTTPVPISILVNRKRARDTQPFSSGQVLASALALTESAKFPLGTLEYPYNAGFFQETALQLGIEPSVLFKKFLRSIREGNLGGMQGSFAKGGAPFRLYGARGQWLRTHVQAALMHQLPPQEVMRHLNTLMVFDGVHLTLSGFAAAAVSEDAHNYSAHVPSGKPILTLPSSSTVQGSRHSTTSANSSESEDDCSAERAAARNTDFRYDPVEGIGSSHCSLAGLYSRWPHLLRLLREASSSLVDACKSFLAADAAGISLDTPSPLALAYYEHLQRTQTCAGMWVHRAEGSYFQNVGLTSRIMELLGFDLQSLTDYVHCDSDTLQGRSVHWIHPSCLARRAAAALDASIRGADAYSFEGLFLRMVGGQGVADTQTEVWYSPFYGVQTCHFEQYPNGQRRMETIYLSDIVHARAASLQQAALETAKTEVYALQSLLQAHSGPTPAGALQRQASNPLEYAMEAINALDAESQVRLLKRLGMLMSRRRDPLLLRSISSQDARPELPHLADANRSSTRAVAVGGSATASAPVSTVNAEPPLQSLAGLDWATLDTAYALLEQHFGAENLAALAAGVMSTSQQPPKEAICMFGVDQLHADFPFSSITAQNTRWQ